MCASPIDERRVYEARAPESAPGPGGVRRHRSPVIEPASAERTCGSRSTHFLEATMIGRKPTLTMREPRRVFTPPSWFSTRMVDRGVLIAVVPLGFQ